MEKYKSYIYKNKFPDLRKTALLIIDGQNGLGRPLWNIAENINDLSHAYRRKNTPIIWLQHFQTIINKNTMYRQNWRNHSMQEGKEDGDFCPRLDATEDEPIIIKNEYDAFYNTTLDRVLKKLCILELVIVGGLTNFSCASTARTAITLNYKVHIVSDATAATDEYIQDATLASLANCFAYIHSSSELIKHSERSKVSYKIPLKQD